MDKSIVSPFSDSRCSSLCKYTSQSYGTSPVIWDHSVTCYYTTQVNAPRLTPARKAVTRLTNPWGMEGWVDHLCTVSTAVTWRKVAFSKFYKWIGA